MSTESRTMVKVQYGPMLYEVPKQVKDDADALFGRWKGNSVVAEGSASVASYVTEAAKKTQALKETRAKLSALKSKVASLPDRVRKQYFG